FSTGIHYTRKDFLVGTAKRPHRLTVWSGFRTGTGPWHWVSEDLPGALSKRFPSPVFAQPMQGWREHARHSL
ncbi:MAG: hypothetical protein M1493_09570, partial [Firmicutes bacterium]|nr:hypothetical protein [Bacillota bacterium]